MGNEHWTRQLEKMEINCKRKSATWADDPTKNQVAQPTVQFEDEDDKEICYAAKIRAKRDLDKFNRARPRKWIWTFVAFFVFLGVGFGGAKGISLVLGGLFSRENLDKIAEKYAKEFHMKDLVSDEALIVSLDFNTK